VNDLDFVEHVVSLLAQDDVHTWIFGGWAEELRGLAAPGEHADVDLLHPAETWDEVDELDYDWIAGKRFPWKRAFRLEGTMVELFLVQRDAHGWYTELERRRHDWPENVFATERRLPVASTAALVGYRYSHGLDAAA